MSEKMKTHLANNVEVAVAKSQLDENAKRLLANKQVLAWIIKYTMEEFKDYELMEIEGCIEGEPEVGTLLFFTLFTTSCCTLFTTVFEIVTAVSAHYSIPIMHIKYSYQETKHII